MNPWYRKLSVFVVAGAVYLTGEYLRGTWFVNTKLQLFCHPIIENGMTYCNSPYLNEGLALMALGQMLAIVAVILLLANADTFRRWIKFSVFYIPIAVALAYLIYPIRFAPAPITPISQAVYPFGWLYVLITFGIVFWGFVIRRRKTS